MKLAMAEACEHIATEASWRIRTILRARRFYGTCSLVSMYKSLVLSFIEASSMAYFHATPSATEVIDSVNVRFCTQIGNLVIDAFTRFWLVPL